MSVKAMSVKTVFAKKMFAKTVFGETTFTRKLLATAITTALLSACGNGGGGSDSSSNGSNDNNTVTAETRSLTVPEQIDVVTANSEASPRSRARTARSVGGFDAPNTDYSNAEQRYHTWHPALKPVQTVNEILCFIGQLKGTDLAGSGNYVALIDKNGCEKGSDSGSSESQSDSAENVTTYVQAIVNASRATSTSPLQVKMWIPEMPQGDSGETMALLANIIVSSGPTDSKPYGDFHMSFGFFPSMEEAIDNTGHVNMNAAVGRGELYTTESGSNVGFDFYMENSLQNEMGGPGHGPGGLEGIQDQIASAKITSTAAVLTSVDGTTGTGITQSTISGLDSNAHDTLKNVMAELFQAWGLAYNSNNVLVGKASELSEVAGTDAKQCLSRNEFREAVWRYGVYNAADGSEKTLNSGFPFRYDSDNDGTDDAFGHAGYWGVWAQKGDDMNGKTITRQSFGEDAQNADPQTYTVTQIDGRLMKKSVETLAVSSLGDTQFDYWDQNGGSTAKFFEFGGGDNAGFYRTGTVQNGENGSQVTPTTCGASATPTAEICAGDKIYPIWNYDESLNLYSRELGGSVRWKTGADVITFFREEYVDSGKLADDLDLLCYNQCPKAGLTADDALYFMNAYDQPFTGSSTVSPISYGFAISGDNANILYRNTATAGQVTLSGSASDWDSTPFSFGLHSGMLIERSVADAAGLPLTSGTVGDPSVFNKLYNGDITEFYEWQTGLNEWDKQTILIDNATSEAVTFDKPLQMTYQHSTANDRAGDDTYDGRTFMLEYGGKGQLWGFPMDDVNGDDEGGNHRFYPVFNLKDGTALDDDTGNYVVKALEIEQFMQEKDVSECSGLSLNSVPAAATSLTADYDVQIGAMPVIDADQPAAVVAGVVQ